MGDISLFSRGFSLTRPAYVVTLYLWWGDPTNHSPRTFEHVEDNGAADIAGGSTKQEKSVPLSVDKAQKEDSGGAKDPAQILKERMAAMAAEQAAKKAEKMAKRLKRLEKTDKDNNAEPLDAKEKYKQMVRKLESVDKDSSGSGGKWLVRWWSWVLVEKDYVDIYVYVFLYSLSLHKENITFLSTFRPSCIFPGVRAMLFIRE